MKATDIPHFIRKYKADMIVFSLCLIIAFGLYLVLGKKMYRSQTEILVTTSPYSYTGTEPASDAGSQASGLRSETVKNELRILTSNDALMSVASQIAGPETSHWKLFEIRDYIKENLSASIVDGTDIISLKFDFPNAFAAQNVLRSILEQYKNRHSHSYFGEAERNRLNNKMLEARASYNQAVSALNALAGEIPGIDDNDDTDNDRSGTDGHLYLDDRQIAALTEVKEQLQTTLKNLSSEYAYTIRKRDYIQGLMRNIPSEVLYGTTEVPNEQYTRLQERLNRSTAERARLLSRENPDPKSIKKLEDEIKQIQALIKKEPRYVMDADEKESRLNEARDALNRQLLELYPEVEAQYARMESVREQVREIDERFAKAAESKELYEQRLRDVELKKAGYDQTKAEYDLAMGKALPQHIPLGTVISSPSYSPEEVSPKLGNTLAWAAVLFIAGNCGLFMLCLKYDTTTSRPWQAAEKFKLPIVGMLDSGSETTATSALPYFEMHKDKLREIYVQLHSGEQLPKSILFTSVDTIPEDLSAAEAFAAYAMKYHNRKPVVVRYSPGEEDKTQNPTGNAGRYPGLPVYSRAAANLQKERLLWEKLKNNCDMLVIEVSPLYEGEFLFALAETMDEAVVSFEMEQTENLDVQHLLDVLRKYSLKTAGLVLYYRPELAA